MGKRAFTIIELLVTISIIGLLLVTILPSLSKYGRSNNVNIAAQTVRQALAETQSFATAPDPNTCPFLSGVSSNWWSINAYGFYANPGGTTPTNIKPAYAADPDGSYPAGYTCGQYSDVQNLAQNQYAILALHVSADPDDATSIWISVIGIVKIETIESPAQFIQNGTTNAPTHPIFFAFNSPDGGFRAQATYAGGTGFDIQLNQILATGNLVNIGATTYTTALAANNKFAIITLGNADSYTSTLFINILTGQVTSTNKAPNGFTPQ
ncbi:MAG: prepilin-type N-terminal cleavage/methylation domain-containing protein [Patescibacteria group bacterium]